MKDQEREIEQGVNVRVEALLARTLAPHPPPENLRRQVQQRVATAWERRPLPLRQRVEGLLRAPLYRRAWVPVAALAVVAVALGLIFPSGGVPVVGTALGQTETVVIVLAAVALVVVIVWFTHKRRY